MSFQIPGWLPINGRRCNRVMGSYGVGRLKYMNPETMEVYDVFIVKCIHRGQHYYWCKIYNQDGTASIKVMRNGHAPPFEGQALLCRVTRVEGVTPVAEESWPIVEIPAERQQREIGVVVEVKHGYGFVRNQDGCDVFAHASQLQNGAQLFVGARVSYRRGETDKGYQAWDIRPA